MASSSQRFRLIGTYTLETLIKDCRALQEQVDRIAIPQQGPQGEAGPAGVKGDAGETGEPGVPGAPGQDGFDGEDGLDGQDATASPFDYGFINSDYGSITVPATFFADYGDLS